MASTYGILSIVPLAVMIILAVATKKIIEPLILSTLIAFMVTDGWGFFPAWASAVESQIAGFAYYAFLYACVGALIKLLEKSNGAQGFSQLVLKGIKSRKAALLATWAADIAIFTDNYLNALTVGVAMRKVTDKFKVSREFLTYVINSTGAPVCVLVPISVWGIFLMSQFEKYDLTVNGSALKGYLAAIPFMVYCWAAIISVPLYIFGIIPLFGKIKEAEARAQAGQTIPPSMYEGEIVKQDESDEASQTGSARDFIIPISILIVYALYSGNLLYASIFALASCIILYIPTKNMSAVEFFENCMDGVKDMLFIMILLVFVFLLGTCGEKLGVTEYITGLVGVLVLPKLLPLITFVTVSLLAIGTGSFWASAAIAAPIFLKLASTGGSNQFLIMGAVASAIVLASHISFWNDGVTVSCIACQIRNTDYADKCVVLSIVPVVFSLLFYLVAGFIF